MAALTMFAACEPNPNSFPAVSVSKTCTGTFSVAVPSAVFCATIKTVCGLVANVRTASFVLNSK